jgi:hypothetical protein
MGRTTRQRRTQRFIKTCEEKEIEGRRKAFWFYVYRVCPSGSLNKSWLSENVLITMDIIENHPDFGWDWEQVSGNPNLTLDMMKRHPDEDWNFKNLSCNPGLTIEMINEYPNGYWKWRHISSNPAITMNIVESHPELPWNWNSMSTNPNLTIDMVKRHLDSEWDWYSLSLHSNITIDNMIDNLGAKWKWNWGRLGRRADFTPACAVCPAAFVNTCVGGVVGCIGGVCWYFQVGDILAHSSSIMRFLEGSHSHTLYHPYTNWSTASALSSEYACKLLSVNPHLSLDYVEKHAEWPWHWDKLSSHPELTIGFVRHQIDKPWDWNRISANASITMDTVRDNPDLPWVWGWVSCNPNLDFETILREPSAVPMFIIYPEDNVHPSMVYAASAKLHQKIHCVLGGEKPKFMKAMTRRYMAAYRIQQYWHKAVTNPYCTIGHNRVMRDYDRYVKEFHLHVLRRDSKV